MTDCHICTRHTLTGDGDHTSRCRHTRATTGNLCQPCAQRIRDDLDAIAAACGCTPPGHGPGAGSGERSLPGGTEWLDYQHGRELVDLLASWARVWHEDANADLPWPARTIPALATWLRTHLDTVGARHEAVADFAHELHAHAQRARRLLGDIPAGHIVPCPCGRRLRAEAHNLDADIVCRGCGTRWTARSLIIHAGDDDAWLDAQAITEWLGVPASTLRRWARGGHVQRRNGLYLVGSVRNYARTLDNTA